MKIKSIIFDLGGTLINSLSVRDAIVNLRSLHLCPGLKISEATAKKVIKLYSSSRMADRTGFKETNLAVILENIFRHRRFGKKSAQDATQKIYDYLTNNKIFPETLRVLKQLNLDGYRIGIISNSAFPSRYHMPLLIESGINKYVDEILFSADFGYKKPHESIYREMFKRLGVESNEVLFVGDSRKCDIEGPKTLGTKAVLIVRGQELYQTEGYDQIRDLYGIFNHLPEMC
jgi:HAD superfamily hydrolase (TIGR01662 family)